MKLDISFFFLQTTIQVLEVEQQDDCDGAGDARVCKIEHRTEEQHFARAVVNQRKIEHIHHASVEPAAALKQLAVAHAIDDVAQRAGYDERNCGDEARARLLLVNERVDVSA